MKKEWISGNELLMKYGILERDLLCSIRNGLTPYEQFTETPIPCPKYAHASYHARMKLHNLNRIRSIVNNPENQKKRIKLVFEKYKVGDLIDYVCHVYPEDFEDSIPEQLSIFINMTAIPEVNDELEGWYNFKNHTEGDDIEGFHIRATPNMVAEDSISHCVLYNISDIEPIVDSCYEKMNPAGLIVSKDDPHQTSWKYFIVPENADDINKIFMLLKSAIFLINDINNDSISQNHTVDDRENVFVNTGPTWKIVYEGKETAGLKGKGFKFIHFLVANQERVYHTDDLQKHAEPVDTEFFESSGNRIEPVYNPEESLQKSNAGYLKGKKTIEDHWNGDEFDIQDKATPTTKAWIHSENIRLKHELEKEKRDGNPDAIKEAEEEYKQFLKYATQCVGKGGKSRRDVDPSDKNKNKISKSIERALDEIKIYDQNLYLHFKRSLGTINSFNQSYNPDRKIEWKTH